MEAHAFTPDQVLTLYSASLSTGHVGAGNLHAEEGIILRSQTSMKRCNCTLPCLVTSLL